jgi:hypothetical protein
MFGFNANVILNVNDFHEFNSLRKNQLLRFYDDIEPIIGDCTDAIRSAKGATKYRDYCKYQRDRCWNLREARRHYFSLLLFFRISLRLSGLCTDQIHLDHTWSAPFTLQILWDNTKLDRKSWSISITTRL